MAMLPYELSIDAENDLREVARYTVNKWGKEALKKYRGGLKSKFIEIGESTVSKRSFSDDSPNLFVTKYRYHYIFYITKNVEKPIIIGVIHEARDIVNRLSERLN